MKVSANTSKRSIIPSNKAGLTLQSSNNSAFSHFKTSFHRHSPSFNKTVRKVLVQNNLRYVNIV